jgi:hypothetical protein
MEIDYYSKYLKYKAKYLELKNQIAGAKIFCCKICDCLLYDEADPNTHVCTCGHNHLNHHTFATNTTECPKNKKKDCTKCNCWSFNPHGRLCSCGHDINDHTNPHPDYRRLFPLAYQSL